jgi:hypothetical protein
MSQENVEIATRTVDAYNRRDLDRYHEFDGVRPARDDLGSRRGISRRWWHTALIVGAASRSGRIESKQLP